MRRKRVPELMDDPTLNGAAHAHALRSLNRVDRWLGMHRAQSRSISQVSPGGDSVLDLGCGGCGFLNYLAERGDATLNGPPVLIGLDYSLFALQFSKTQSDKGLHRVVADARALPFADESVDVVTCSLFLHHFDPADVVTILREAARVARQGIVVSDLSRSSTAWALTSVFARLASRSRVFHVDGPRSVRAAYRAAELAEMAGKAGLAGATVRRQIPFRIMLQWKKRGAARDM